MKIGLVILALLALIGGGYVYLQSAPFGQAPLAVLASGDAKELVSQARSFMEDIRYKDFKAAEKYSLPEQRDQYDIARLIERLFKIKPEVLDLQSYEVVSTDLDSSGERARVHVKSEVKLLNSDKHKSPEMILYFKKEKGQWYMDLASSLK